MKKIVPILLSVVVIASSLLFCSFAKGDETKSYAYTTEATTEPWTDDAPVVDEPTTEPTTEPWTEPTTSRPTTSRPTTTKLTTTSRPTTTKLTTTARPTTTEPWTDAPVVDDTTENPATDGPRMNLFQRIWCFIVKIFVFLGLS